MSKYEINITGEACLHGILLDELCEKCNNHFNALDKNAGPIFQCEECGIIYEDVKSLGTEHCHACTFRREL